MTDSMMEDAGNVALRIAIADEIMAAVDQCHALPNLRQVMRPAARGLGLRLV